MVPGGQRNRSDATIRQPCRRELGVTIEPTVVAGVQGLSCLTPKAIPEKNRDRLVIALHGGGYVFYPGRPGTGEAVMMAGFGGFKVRSYPHTPTRTPHSV